MLVEGEERWVLDQLPIELSDRVNANFCKFIIRNMFFGAKSYKRNCFEPKHMFFYVVKM